MSGRRRRLAAVIAVAAWGSLAAVHAAGASSSRFVPSTGSAPPPLALQDLGGTRHTLDRYRGHVVLVNFWATWCEPCVAEMASLQRLKSQLAGQRFTILAVNYGESDVKVRGFLPTLGVDFAALLDPGRQAARAWAVRILPMSFVVDRDGQLRYTVVGELDWTTEEATATVRQLLR